MQKQRKLAVAAFITAILPWVLWGAIQLYGAIDWLWIFPLPAPISVVLALLAYGKKLKHPEIYGGEPYYISAMVLGIIASAFLVAFIISGPPDNT